MVQIGSRILEYRKKMNMSQEEFANKIGVSRQAVSKWELDKAYPDLDKLVDICGMFDLSLDELVNGVEQDEEPVMEAEQRVEIPNDPVNVSDVGDNQTVTDNIESEFSDEKGSDEKGSDKEGSDKEGSDKEGSDKESSDSKKHTVRIGSHGGLRVVMYAAAALAVFCIVISFVIILQNAWKHSDEVLMHVDKVHAQYTLADVSYLNDDLDDKHRLMWIDAKGIRAGDTLPGYIDDDGELANVDHDISTFVIPCVMAFVFLIMFILLRIELAKEHQMDIERAISDVQEKA